MTQEQRNRPTVPEGRPVTYQLVYGDRSGPCGHWDGAAGSYCLRADGVRMYLPGRRCPDHTPAALVGQREAPEATTPPWWIRDGKPIALPPLSTVFDLRAVASGRRVSGARRRQARLGEDYDDAQGRR